MQQNIEPSPRERGQVMVVDDDPVNLTLIEEILRGEGYEVRCLPGGPPAIASAKRGASGSHSARYQNAGNGRLHKGTTLTDTWVERLRISHPFGVRLI